MKKGICIMPSRPNKLAQPEDWGLVRRSIRNSLCLLLIAVAMVLVAAGMSSCKAWRTYSTTATYSVAPDKSGNPVTTIQTKTVEEYTGVKKN